MYKLAEIEWQPASSITCDYVRHRNPQKSPGKIGRLSNASDIEILVSVIIPTSDADRNGCFQRLLDQLSRQTMQQFEIIIIKGDPRQGRAINIGAELARGKYLVTLDDDTSLPDAISIRKLVETMDAYSDIGIAGGNAVIPDNASSFIKRALRQIPRRSWEPVKAITESDLAQHPCLIMRAEEFKLVGGENELIPRGLDPYLREEFRKINKRIVLIPGVNYYHLLPSTLISLIKQFYRNGLQAAYVNRKYPQWVIETPSKHGIFKKKTPFFIRVLRLPLRQLGSIAQGKYIRVLCECAYAAGFLRGLIN